MKIVIWSRVMVKSGRGMRVKEVWINVSSKSSTNVNFFDDVCGFCGGKSVWFFWLSFDKIELNCWAFFIEPLSISFEKLDPFHFRICKCLLDSEMSYLGA